MTDNAGKDGYAEHVWGEGEITKPATETEKGQKTFTWRLRCDEDRGDPGAWPAAAG